MLVLIRDRHTFELLYGRAIHLIKLTEFFANSYVVGNGILTDGIYIGSAEWDGDH
jgi:hypothetical protein